MTFEPDWAAPPGETIVRLLSIKEIASEELAEELGLDCAGFDRLLAGFERISNEAAETLAEYLGSTAEFWLRRDEIYASEINRLDRSDNDEIQDWISSLPTRQMSQYGWIAKNLRSKKLQQRLFVFFGCSNYSEWKANYVSGLDAVAFRTSSAFEANDMATLVWKRVGEIQAFDQDLPEFDRDGFVDLLPDLKRLGFIRSPKLLISRLRAKLNEVGVALSSAKSPNGCRASGATWLSETGNPVVHLSFRHLSDDHFWFTFYHEAAHVALGHGDHVAYERTEVFQVKDHQESEANALASSLLVPEEIWKWLLSRNANKQNVITAARKSKTTPGVIVGQLEKAGVIPYGKLSYLKRRFTWGESSFTPIEK